MSDGDSLKFNPGGRIRRKRPICQCLLWTGVACIVLIGLSMAVIMARTSYKMLGKPHHELHYEAKKGESYDLATVVQPLIDEKQRFDIFTTVWLRTLVDKTEDGDEVFDEKAIFQDTLFGGVHLKDKHLNATVKYRIPTEIFKRHNLCNFDLRASFVLVPNSPSLLDYVANYSTWTPEGVNKPPSRLYDASTARSLKDEVLDSFAMNIPLIDFHPINDSCLETLLGIGKKTVDPFLIGTDDDDEEEEEEQVGGRKGPGGKQANKGKKKNNALEGGYESTEGLPVLKSHPYVITRSFVQIVDMTKPYKRKPYNKFQKDLRRSSCGQDEVPPKVDWKSCERTYYQNGNMETKLQLRVPASEATEGGTQWAYAPYLASNHKAWGPKDLVAVPVTRQNCTISETASIRDQEFLDIEWKVAFASVTPAKLFLGRLSALGAANWNMTATEEEILYQQDTVQRIQGLRGHKFADDVHPRRVFVVGIVRTIISVFLSVLEIYYWATLASTIGISIPGTALIALSAVLEYVLAAGIHLAGDQNESFMVIVLQLLFDMPSEIQTWFMVKAITRADFGWKKGSSFIPKVSFAEPTHGERTSQRTKGVLTWPTAISMYLLVCGVFHFLKPEAIYIIKPRGPLNTPSVPYAVTILKELSPSLQLPALLIGQGAQTWFNHCSRTFAGTYRIAMILAGITKLLQLLSRFSGSFMGNNAVRDGYSVVDCVTTVLLAIGCYQAWSYPKVLPEEEEEE